MAGRTTTRWTPEEDAILTRTYPHGGPQATTRALSIAGYHRPEGATRARASTLRIRHRAIGTPKHEPTCGPRPTHRLPAWSIWPPTFTDVLDLHPELALAFTGRLDDTWRAIA
jgi:hypothetical protein